MKKTLIALLILLVSASALGRGSGTYSRQDLLSKLHQWEADVRAWKPSEEDWLEKDVELEWIYRLKSSVQSQYAETDASLIRIIGRLQQIENLPENISTSRLAPFLDFLVKALRDEREPTEPIFDFIRETTESGSILSPPTLIDLSESRAYRSRGLSVAALPLDLEEVAQSLDVGELAEPLKPQLATEATVLHPAEGDAGIAADKVVQSDEPAIEPASDAKPTILVPAEDSPAQPEDGQVREL